MKFSIRLLYLYLFSFIGLLVFVIGSIRLVELGLKVYVFGGADQFEYSKPIQPVELTDSKLTKDEIKKQDDEAKMFQERENKRQREREVSGALAMIVVGGPLYLYHWRTINKKDKTE